MLTVWKYPFLDTGYPDSGYFECALPTGARILHIGVQADAPTLWILVDTDNNQKVVRRFFAVATGQALPLGIGYGVFEATADKFLGTVFIGAFVFHIFEMS